MLGKLLGPERLQDQRPDDTSRCVQHQQGEKGTPLLGGADGDLAVGSHLSHVAEYPKQHAAAPKAAPAVPGERAKPGEC